MLASFQHKRTRLVEHLDTEVIAGSMRRTVAPCGSMAMIIASVPTCAGRPTTVPPAAVIFSAVAAASSVEKYVVQARPFPLRHHSALFIPQRAGRCRQLNCPIVEPRVGMVSAWTTFFSTDDAAADGREDHRRRWHGCGRPARRRDARKMIIAIDPQGAQFGAWSPAITSVSRWSRAGCVVLERSEHG